MVKIQCYICLISAILNYISAHIMIKSLGMGIKGASFSMTVSYFVSFALSYIS